MADGKVVIDVTLDDGRVVKGVANLNNQLLGVGKAGQTAALGLKNLLSAIGITAVVAKGIDMVKSSLDGAISRYDTLNNFPRVLQLMGFDAKESKKSIDTLSKGIQGLPTTLDSVAKTTQRLALMTGDLKGATKTTLALNDAFLASGASAADAERGLEQYVQMLSTGTVDLESWRTLQETMPIALNKTAEAFGFTGKSAQNDLYKALQSGQITIDQFNSKLIELDGGLGGFADLAHKSSGGIQTAWTNMKTAVVRGVTDIIDAINNVLKNTPLKSIENVINNIGNAFNKFLSGVAQGITNSSGLIEGIVGMFQGNFSQIGQVIANALPSIITAITGFTPKIIAVFVEIFPQIVQSFMNHYPQMVAAFIQILNALVSTITQNLPLFINAAMQILMALANGLLQAMPQIINATITIIKAFMDMIIQNLPLIINMGITLLSALIDGITKELPFLINMALNLIDHLLTTLLNNLPKIINAGMRLLNALIDGISDHMPLLIEMAIYLILKLFDTLINHLPQIIEAGIRIIVALAGGLVKAIPKIIAAIPKIVKAIFKAFGDIDWGKIGKNIIKGIGKGLSSLAGWLWQKAKDVVDGIKDGMLKLLGIHSPSRWMRDMIGKNMVLGWVQGIDTEKSSIMKKSQQMTDWMKPDIPVVSGFMNRLKAVGTPVKGLVPNVAIAGDNPIVNSRRTYGQTLKAPEYAIVNIDGRQVMKATMDYYIDEQKRRDAIRDRFRG